MIINVNEIISNHSKWVAEWHEEFKSEENEYPWSLVEENHKWNFLLWHEEDIARMKDIQPQKMVEVKRNIDRYNQLRNNAMEKMDEWVLEALHKREVEDISDRLHTETPGMIIDRLSILSLKKFHMEEQVERVEAGESHVATCRVKLNIIENQITDLANSLERILGELEKGQLKFKVYRQLKMYNDPSLNPQLYKHSK